MSKTLLPFILLVLILASINGNAQVNDAGLWVSGTAQKNLSETFAVQLSQEVRIMENVTEASTVFTDLGVDYRISKPLKLSIHYRHTFDRRLDDSYDRKSRFYTDLSGRIKLKPLVFQIRERIQSEFVPNNSRVNTTPEWYSRTKAQIKLDLDKNWSPYLFSEGFTPLNPGSDLLIDKIRYGGGLEFQILKKHTIDAAYMIQSKFQDERETDFIFVVGYSIML
ncbi:MAG: DUF2490 domain-containing protein [Bacteroidales bacterium]|nr:DUF2490 domain-containing protein [Bacteroidales bacterium]